MKLEIGGESYSALEGLFCPVVNIDNDLIVVFLMLDCEKKLVVVIFYPMLHCTIAFMVLYVCKHNMVGNS